MNLYKFIHIPNSSSIDIDMKLSKTFVYSNVVNKC